MSIKALTNLTHFWGKTENSLAIFFKDSEGLIYICGGWECPISENDIELISVIDRPDVDLELYYS